MVFLKAAKQSSRTTRLLAQVVFASHRQGHSSVQAGDQVNPWAAVSQGLTDDSSEADALEQNLVEIVHLPVGHLLLGENPLNNCRTICQMD